MRPSTFGCGAGVSQTGHCGQERVIVCQIDPSRLRGNEVQIGWRGSFFFVEGWVPTNSSFQIGNIGDQNLLTSPVGANTCERRGKSRVGSTPSENCTDLQYVRRSITSWSRPAPARESHRFRQTYIFLHSRRGTSTLSKTSHPLPSQKTSSGGCHEFFFAGVKKMARFFLW